MRFICVIRGNAIAGFRMNRITRSLLAVAAATALTLSFTGCASMFSGTTQQVVFNSPQPKSSVTVEGQQYALPATARISKKTTKATFTNPRYPSRELEWKRDFQAGYLFMDILFTPGYGLVGIIVDASTSAWLKHPAVIDYDFATGRTSVKEAARKSQPARPAQ
jgi:hypothetical protein